MSSSPAEFAVGALVVIPHRITLMGFMRSQVVQPFSHLAKSGVPVTLLTVGSASDKADGAFSEACAALGIEVVFASEHRLGLVRFVQGCRMGLRLLRMRPGTVLYAREVWGGLMACAIQSLGRTGRIVYDFRGAVPEEVRYQSPNLRGHLKAALFELFERLIVSRAGRLSAVTQELADHVEALHGKRPDPVIPCCVTPADSTTVENARASLGLAPDDLVLVYSGGMSAWQQFDRVVAMVRELLPKEPKVKLLVLTNEMAVAETILLPALPEDAFRVLSLPQHKVATYLRAGDAGVLFREDVLLNQVAFPIKFAEYLAVGLPVIVTPGAKAIARLVAEHDLGLVVSGHPVDDVAAWLPGATANLDLRRRCETFAQKHLTWAAHDQAFRNMYAWNG